MVNQRLVAYIRTYLSRGHPLEKIKDALIKQGFSMTEIEEAANIASPPPVAPPKEELELNKPLIIGVTILAIAVVFVIYFMLVLPQGAITTPEAAQAQIGEIKAQIQSVVYTLRDISQSI